jgi:hypothetical protein
VPLKDLLAVMPERPLPLIMGRFWPPKQYQILIVSYPFVGDLPS